MTCCCGKKSCEFVVILPWWPLTEPSKKITDVFKQHGGTPLDTPVFELKEILSGSMATQAGYNRGRKPG